MDMFSKPRSGLPKKGNLASGSRVFVGMSGGVDSSVAALLLKEQGYGVVGVFIKSWDGLPTNKGLQFREQCRWREDRRDAMRVAAKLKIPFRTYDFTAAYRKKVIEYFFREHAAGRTPNPDVMCNKEIKFKLFLERALSEGANFIATGHYSRKSEVQSSKFQTRYELLMARDTEKDQSYFLYTLGQRELARTLFPVGEYTKTEVRKIAEHHGLPTAMKPDSQGICFVGEVPVMKFLRARLLKRVGAVITADGRTIGEHDGVAFYTIGQRHGLRLSSRLPYYVAQKDVRNNIIKVAEGNDDSALYQDEIMVVDLSWVNRPPNIGIRFGAKIRYRQKLEPAIAIMKNNNGWLFKFDRPQRAVTPGQSLVLYDGEKMIGGGIIA